MNDRVMTHVLRPESTDINYFFNSRDGDKYREKIARQVILECPEIQILLLFFISCIENFSLTRN